MKKKKNTQKKQTNKTKKNKNKQKNPKQTNNRLSTYLLMGKHHHNNKNLFENLDLNNSNKKTTVVFASPHH